jgi:DNA-binding winged helix-turn-helix (wHTH) protein
VTSDPRGPGVQFIFPPYTLDPVRRRLTASDEPVAISDRHLDVLLLLVARAGHIVSKDDLLETGWKDVAVGDNSLEQAISSLRRLLGPGHIGTVPRRGYRFDAPVTRGATRVTDEALDLLLAPHRAFIEGRAALETFDGDQVAHARSVFERAVEASADHAAAHIGLANACAMQFEMSRADPAPDSAALMRALQHAREACRLDPRSGEAWATLGFALGRVGSTIDALAAGKRAVAIEPDNWRHHLRLAYAGWGEERLRAAYRTLTLLPGFPLAHWLAATVHVARHALDEAMRELSAAVAAQPAEPASARFSLVAVHWLRGLLHLTDGDEGRALEEFEHEIALEGSSHLYARECSASAWYAIGALRMRQGRPGDAATAFRHAIALVSTHRLARAGLAGTGQQLVEEPDGPAANPVHPSQAFDIDLARAVTLALAGAHEEAAGVMDAALTAAPPGNAGWILPVEPLLNVRAHPGAWSRVLARLRARGA